MRLSKPHAIFLFFLENDCLFVRKGFPVDACGFVYNIVNIDKKDHNIVIRRGV